MNYVTQGEAIEVIEYNDNLREYIIKIEKERKYNPGSFVQLSLDLVTSSDIWPDSRTFSIASYEKGIMKFIVKRTGVYTSRIFNELTIGKKCTIKYPFGELFNKNLENEKHLFLAGGVGITPYISLIKYYEINGLLDNIRLFYSVKYSDDFIHYDELKEVLGNNMEVFITRENIDGYKNRKINIEDIKRVADRETNIYICGSKSFNKTYKKILLENGFNQIHMDEWE